MACHGRVLRERQVPWLKTDDFDESLLLDLNAGEDGDVLKNLRDLPSVLEDALGECAHAKKLATAVQAVCSTTVDQIESVKVCMSSQSSSCSRSSWAREAGSKTALGQSVQHIREAASRHMASLRQSLSFNPAVAAGAWKASPQAAYKTTTHDKNKKKKASEAKKEAEDTVRKESREHRPARPTPHLRGFQQSLAAASAAAVPPPPPLASAPRSSAPPSVEAPAARRSRRQEKRDSATTLRSPSPLRGEEEKDGAHTASYGASRSSSRDEARARAAGDESGRSSSSDQDGQLHALKFISGKFLLHADPDEEDLGQPEEEAKGGALPPASAQQTRLIAEVRPTHQPVAAEQLAEAFFASRGPANEAARDMAWSGVGALENKSEDDDEREEEEPEEAEAPKHRSLRCHLLFSSPLCMERPVSLGLSCKGAPSKDAVEALCRDFGLEFRSLEPAVLSSVTGEAALWNRRHKHAEAMIQPGDELFKVFLRARREDACPEAAHPPPASGPSESPSRSVAPMIVPGAPVEILAQGQGPGTLVAQLVHRVPALAKVPEVQLQLVFKGMRPLPQLQVEEEVAEVRQSGCEVLPSAATSQNLRHLIARADCEVLHLALHCSSGQARHLFLEDPQGKAHIMTAEACARG